MDINEFNRLDNDRININEYYEVEYWANQFGLHPQVLKNLVKESGINSAEALRGYLHKKYGESAA